MPSMCVDHTQICALDGILVQFLAELRERMLVEFLHAENSDAKADLFLRTNGLPSLRFISRFTLFEMSFQSKLNSCFGEHEIYLG